VDALYDWLSDLPGPCRPGCADLVLGRWGRTRASLLTFDFGRFAVPLSCQPPLITLPPALLLARLADEYVFAELCEAALMAFAAEKEARVAAMLSAKENLEHMGSDLRALEREIRQDEITAEVVELASGANVACRWPSHRQ
jgi:F-type H+-transporting ATPase subunit gamma